MVKRTQKYWQRQYRKKGNWVYIQFRISKDEREKLKDLCYEMRITMQEFCHKMLVGKLPKPPIKEEIPTWVEKGIDAGLAKAEEPSNG